MEAIKTAITTAWEAIKTAVLTVMEAVKTAVTTVVNAIKDTVTQGTLEKAAAEVLGLDAFDGKVTPR